MTEEQRDTMLFDAAVRRAIRARAEADAAKSYLYTCVDGMATGYAGTYLGVYLAVSGMDDVDDALDEAVRGRGR